MTIQNDDLQIHYCHESAHPFQLVHIKPAAHTYYGYFETGVEADEARTKLLKIWQTNPDGTLEAGKVPTAGSRFR